MDKQVIIVGDGPGGLSAALFLAKNGMSVAVYGQDKTAMHWALLNNYLGIPQITGTKFQEVARKQVTAFGADLHDMRVEQVEQKADGFAVTLADDTVHTAAYVVLAEGKGR